MGSSGLVDISGNHSKRPPGNPGLKNIMSAQPRWHGGEYIFSTPNGRTPSSGFSKTEKRFDSLSKVDNWTFHDVRRSAATYMARAGVIQEHIERFLGHAISGMAGTYYRYSYFDENQDAMLVWEKTMDNIADV